jgi:hypothetical protein
MIVEHQKELLHINALNKHLGQVLDRYIDAIKVSTPANSKMKQRSPTAALSSPSSENVKLNDILKEYIMKNKSDYENFMEPDVLKHYVDDNRKCTMFVQGIKRKVWRPDKFRVNSRKNSVISLYE